MLDSILSSVSTTVSLSLPQLLLCTAASLAMGLGIALVYMYKNTYSKNFVVTLALLPAMVPVSYTHLRRSAAAAAVRTAF